MTDLNTIWANTQADGDIEKNEPPSGTVGVLRISNYRAGKSKKGELYFAVDVVDDTQGYNWGIYKQFTKNGQPAEGSIKSAKITLRQLGVEVASPAHLDAVLKPLIGRFYTYEHMASDRINTTTGMPFLNTNITGVASPPAQAPAPVQAPVSTQVQTPQGVASFPSALPQQASPDPWPPQQTVGIAPVQNTNVAPAPVAGPTLDQFLAANPVAGTPAEAAQAMQQNVQAAQAAQVPGQVDNHPFQ